MCLPDHSLTCADYLVKWSFLFAIICKFAATEVRYKIDKDRDVL